jgi:hypothetical protein
VLQLDNVPTNVATAIRSYPSSPGAGVVVCAHAALTRESGSPRISAYDVGLDFAKPQVRRGVSYCPGLSRMAVIALLMRFGFIAHPGFKSPSLRHDLGFCRIATL